MDPTEALAEIRAAIEEAEGNAPEGSEFEALIIHFKALDEWLCKGGFLPLDWKTATADSASDQV